MKSKKLKPAILDVAVDTQNIYFLGAKGNRLEPLVEEVYRRLVARGVII